MCFISLVASGISNTIDMVEAPVADPSLSASHPPMLVGPQDASDSDVHPDGDCVSHLGVGGRAGLHIVCLYVVVCSRFGRNSALTVM